MAAVHLNNFDFYYEVHGTGMPLILIAGLSCDSSHWTLIKDQLEAKFKVIYFDNRGVGRSSVPQHNYTLDNMAGDVIGLLQYLDIDKAHILGHSMGGAIAQIIASKYPHIVNKLIISNSLVKLAPKALVWMKHCAKLYIQNQPLENTVPIVAPWVLSNEFLTQPNILEQLITMDSAYPYKQSAIGYSQQVHTLAQFDSRDWVSNITAQTLIIAVEEDVLTPATDSKYIHHKIYNSKLTIQPGAHVPMMEIPEVYVNTVIDFLANI